MGGITGSKTGKEITNGVHQVPKKDTGSICRKEQKRPGRVVRGEGGDKGES